MLEFFSRLSLVTKIIIAIILGIGVALLFPTVTPYLSLFGELFIKALKSVAPILVFVLVLSSIANSSKSVIVQIYAQYYYSM